MKDDERAIGENRLYIPYGLNINKEIFPGFGKQQLGQCIVGTLAVSAVGGIVFLFTMSVAAIVVIIMVGIFGSIMMTIRDAYNQSVLGQIINMVKFRREQQRYNYVYKFFADS